MSRRSNLNTIRRGFNWDSHWTTNLSNYTQILWLDLKITSFLRGVFYVLRLPSSSYIIRRFVSSFVIIETDVWLYNKTSFTNFIPNSYYFSYLVYKVRSMLFNIHLHKKKLLQLHKHKLFSISSIVSHLFNKRRIVIRKKKKMRISKVGIFDTNTLKQRDASRYDLSNWNIVTDKKWVVRRKKSKSGMANLSRMLLWRSQTRSTIWQSAGIRTIARNSAAYRYLWFSPRFMHSYFVRFFKSKIGRFIKFAYRHKHTRVLPKISNVYAILQKYCYLLKRLCNYTKIAYISRNLRNIRMVFRLLNFQAVNAMRANIFSRLLLPSSSVNSAKQSAACTTTYLSGSWNRSQRSYSRTTSFSSTTNNVRNNHNMLFQTQRRKYSTQRWRGRITGVISNVVCTLLFLIFCFACVYYTVSCISLFISDFSAYIVELDAYLKTESKTTLMACKEFYKGIKILETLDCKCKSFFNIFFGDSTCCDLIVYDLRNRAIDKIAYFVTQFVDLVEWDVELIQNKVSGSFTVVQFNLEYEVRLQEFILSIQERLESEEFDKILQHCTPEQQQKLREYRSFLESTLKLLKEQLLEIIKQREQCKQHEQSSQLWRFLNRLWSGRFFK